MSRRHAVIEPDETPAILRILNAARSLSNLCTVLAFATAMGIVALSFTPGM